MKFYYPSLSLSLLLSSFVYSSSLFTDKVNTSVKLSSDKSDPNRFVVNVKRVDDILNKGGDVLAERVYSIVLNFEVEDNMLILNGKKAAPLGQTVMTTINATYVKQGLTDWQKKIATSQFEEGILSISLSSTVENFAMLDENNLFAPPTMGRHITVKEKILSLNGKKIQQDEFVEHVMDLYNDNTLVRQISNTEQVQPKKHHGHMTKPMFAHSKGGKHHGHHHQQQQQQSFDYVELIKWILIGILGGFLVSLIIYVPVFTFLYYYRKRQNAYQQVETEDLPIYTEKPDIVLPKYAQVPSDENEEQVTVYEALAEEETNVSNQTQ